MEELRDKLIERAGHEDLPTDQVKDLVVAACQLDAHVRDLRVEERYVKMAKLKKEGHEELEGRIAQLETDMASVVNLAVKKGGKKKRG